MRGWRATCAHRSPTHLKLGLLPQVRELSDAHRAFGKQYGLKDHGYLLGEEGSEGLSHAMMAESLLVQLDGKMKPGVTAKDVVLTLLAADLIQRGGGLGKVLGFAGPVVDSMSIDERATLTNMVAELGGLTGLCAPDAETMRFWKERCRIDVETGPWMFSDSGAHYAKSVTLDCSTIGPMLARPAERAGNAAPMFRNRWVKLQFRPSTGTFRVVAVRERPGWQVLRLLLPAQLRAE